MVIAKNGSQKRLKSLQGGAAELKARRRRRDAAKEKLQAHNIKFQNVIPKFPILARLRKLSRLAHSNQVQRDPRIALAMNLDLLLSAAERKELDQRAKMFVNSKQLR